MTARVAAVLALGMPLVAYALTLAPGLTWSHYGADGGDLVTAAFTLGIPHPPGYPTYTALAWLFTRLPAGSVAWRVNLFSAVCTATTAALIYWTVVSLSTRIERTRRGMRVSPAEPDQDSDTSRPPNGAADITAIGAGLVAAWTYAFASLVWSQALIAEVYGPLGLWIAVVVALTLRLAHSGVSARTLYVLGLVWSVGFGVHLISIFLFPVVLWAALSSTAPFRHFTAPKRGIYILLGVLTGLLVWVYLPGRAGRGSITWGQPATWSGFWWLVSGALYRDYLFALPIAELGTRLAAWVQAWWGGLGITGIGFATLGAIRLMGSSLGWFIATGLSFAGFNLYALGYDTADSVVYLIPAFVIVNFWLGIGLRRLALDIQTWDERRPQLVVLLLVIGIATPAWSVIHNGKNLNLKQDRVADRFCETAMRDAPRDAVLLSTTDRQTFALWYCQHVKGLRTDVVVVDEGLWGFEWYRTGLESTYPGFLSSPSAANPPIAMIDERPYCHVDREGQTGWLDCQWPEVDKGD